MNTQMKYINVNNNIETLFTKQGKTNKENLKKEYRSKTQIH